MTGVRCPAWDPARADVQHLSGLPSLLGLWQERWVPETGARAFRVTCQTPGRFVAAAGARGGQHGRRLESSLARLACGLGLA